MIPSHPHSTTPPGEIEVFNRLKNDPNTSDWIVLHSLDVVDHIKKVSGEADFLILIPYHGVLCMEVKSHNRVSRRHEGWYYGKNPKPDARGPFKQASEAMHSLRKYLTSRESQFKNLLFWSAACFPNASFSVETCEWDDWQCIDKAKFRRAPISKVCISVLEKSKAKMKENHHHGIVDALGEYSMERLKAVVHIFRPCFEAISPAHSKISVLESEIQRYTEEQYLALDFISGNERVIFPGHAGTGKTFISIEAALRARNDDKGAKINWICFNKNLARWIKKKSVLRENDIKVTYLHNWLLEISGEKPTQSQHNDSNYWDTELPRLAVEKLLTDGVVESEKIDVLIVDEAQDLIHEDLLDFLDFMLVGGLSTGKWMFFGDYTMQTIYKSAHEFDLQTLNGRCHPVALCNLSTNCRNTPRTAHRASRLGRMEPGYVRILRPDDEQEPHFKYYTGKTIQLELLLDTLDSLKEEGYKNEDMVILSPLKDKALVQELKEIPKWKSSLLQETDNISGKIRYSTIHSFKGLEAPVILITDINSVKTRKEEMLLYIGLTRSTDRVYVFIDEKAKEDLLNILLN